MALVLVCMTSLRIGVDERRSYSAMPRSLPVVANTSGSAGLNRTAARGRGRGTERSRRPELSLRDMKGAALQGTTQRWE